MTSLGADLEGDLLIGYYEASVIITDGWYKGILVILEGDWYNPLFYISVRVAGGNYILIGY